MKKAITLLFSMAMTMTITAQNADFENFNLGAEEFLNGSDGSGGFQSGGYYFPNQYNDIWQSWSGWAISSMTDNQTPGPGNQYSAIAGSGADGSNTYAVSFVVGSSIAAITVQDGFIFPSHIMVTNSTYAYLSMLEGDNYAKKFGGVDGNDPDFFLLTIKGYKNGQEVEDSIDFYLADYRFSDNSMDYLIDDWTEVQLAQLGFVDSIRFILSSSDVGVFGMNTPAYFCVDNVGLGIVEGTNDRLVNVDVAIFPNPAIHQLSIDWQEHYKAEASIFSANGQLVIERLIQQGLQTIDVQALPFGSYFLKMQTEEGWVCRRFVKE